MSKYVVLIPLAAMIFHSLGRHPLAGLAAAFAGVSGGYSANLLLGTIDPLLAGITTPAAQMIDPDYVVGAEANWYFMMVSTFLIAILGTLITEKIVEPRLGKYDPSEASVDLSESTVDNITPLEKKGLRWAGITFLLMCILLALSIVPESGILRHPETGLVSGSPFLKGIVAFIFITFAIPGFVYGKVVGTMKTDRDVIDAMSKSISAMGLYIVLVFFAAQFVAFFKWTNFGTIIAIKGAALLQALSLTGPEVFIGFILLCALINLSLGSFRTLNEPFATAELQSAYYHFYKALEGLARINKDTLFIIAAGNNGADINKEENIALPAEVNLANVITVGAVNDESEVTYFSNFGDQSIDNRHLVTNHQVTHS